MSEDAIGFDIFTDEAGAEVAVSPTDTAFAAALAGTASGHAVLAWLACELVSERGADAAGRRQLVLEIFRRVLAGRKIETSSVNILKLIGECVR